MEEEVIYGVLTKRIQITKEFYIFSPVHLIKGMLLSHTCFVDEVGKDYFVLSTNDDNNQMAIYDQDEYYIGWYTNEKLLINAYPDEILENAKMGFYDEMKNNCVVAYFSEKDNMFKFITLDLNNVCNTLSNYLNGNGDLDFNTEEKEKTTTVLENAEIPNLDEVEKSIVLEEKELDKLIDMLDNKDYEQLISILKTIKRTLSNSEEIINEVTQLNETQEKNVSNDTPSKEKEKEIDIKDFYLKTRKKIIDQDDALLDIITAVKMDQYAENASDRSRCFIIGPTGSGKTEILKTLGEYLDKPFIKIDTTQLTTPGYVGGTIEQQLSRLVNLSNGDIKRAESGIVVFDEIDKKAGNRDELFGRGFLDTLLPFLDGTDYIIPVGTRENKTFNTSNLTIFASGSFLEIIKKHSLDKKPIGFNAEFKSESIIKPKIDAEDIFKMSGMPDEFVGRFPVVVQLNELGTESLMRILEQSEISQLQAEKRKFKHLGVDLSWEEKYVEAVAVEAKKLNRGARSLKKIVERTIKYMRREILMNSEQYSEARLLAETVTNPMVYKLK